MDVKSILLRYWQLAAESEGWYPPYAPGRNVEASFNTN